MAMEYIDGEQMLDEMFPKQGRPQIERTREIRSKLAKCRETGHAGLKLKLEDDEQEVFSRFYQRTRSAASSLGLKVKVSPCKGEPTKAAVRIVGEED